MTQLERELGEIADLAVRGKISAEEHDRRHWALIQREKARREQAAWDRHEDEGRPVRRFDEIGSPPS